jgi:hypothetical protein
LLTTNSNEYNTRFHTNMNCLTILIASMCIRSRWLILHTFCFDYELLSKGIDCGVNQSKTWYYFWQLLGLQFAT